MVMKVHTSRSCFVVAMRGPEFAAGGLAAAGGKREFQAEHRRGLAVSRAAGVV